jgi:hypothetical protein
VRSVVDLAFAKLPCQTMMTEQVSLKAVLEIDRILQAHKLSPLGDLYEGELFLPEVLGTNNVR